VTEEDCDKESDKKEPKSAFEKLADNVKVGENHKKLCRRTIKDLIALKC